MTVKIVYLSNIVGDIDINELPLSNGKIEVVPWQEGIQRLFF